MATCGNKECIEHAEALQRNLRESVREAGCLRAELADREEITEEVCLGDRDYFFISKKEYFILVEDDAHIIVRRKVNPCPPK